jgi:hypothetical protein
MKKFPVKCTLNGSLEPSSSELKELREMDKFAIQSLNPCMFGLLGNS